MSIPQDVIISVTSETSEKGKQAETKETEGAEEPLVLPNNLEKILNDLSQEQRLFYDELPKKSKPRFFEAVSEAVSKAVSVAVSAEKKKGDFIVDLIVLTIITLSTLAISIFNKIYAENEDLTNKFAILLNSIVYVGLLLAIFLGLFLIPPIVTILWVAVGILYSGAFIKRY
ncbi:8294_t:CDS:2 [Diversispora eburnea]|uniref:8294_t:CDS:1 n=1 Tax=Diversispora eburnea TaxID=1213867 RepID=A0A9N9CFQ1_9GLOM|nr:8294_t:CDS:2 [Diversispora eburnea]